MALETVFRCTKQTALIHKCKRMKQRGHDVCGKKAEEKWAKSFRSRGRFVTISYASYSFEWFASKSLVRIIIYRIWQVKFLGALPLIRSLAHVHVLSVRRLISTRRCSRIFFYGRTRTYALLMCVFFVHAIQLIYTRSVSLSRTRTHKHFIENSIHTLNHLQFSPQSIRFVYDFVFSKCFMGTDFFLYPHAIP